MNSLQKVRKSISEETLRSSLVIEQPIKNYTILKVEKNISIFNNKITRCDAVIFSNDYSHWGIVEIKILNDWKLSDVTKQLINYCEIVNEQTYELEHFSKLKSSIFNALSNYNSDKKIKLIELIKYNKPFLFLISENTDFDTGIYRLFKEILSQKFNLISFVKFYNSISLDILYHFDNYIHNSVEKKEQEIRINNQTFLIPYPNFLITQSKTISGLHMIKYLNNSIPIEIILKHVNSYHSLFYGINVGSYKLKDGVYFLSQSENSLKLVKKNA